MYFQSILGILALATSFASARQCISSTTSTRIAGSLTISSNSIISAVTPTTAAVNPTATSTTLVSLPASFYVTGYNSGNANADQHPLLTATASYALQFNTQASGYGNNPFSIESASNYLMANGVYVVVDSTSGLVSLGTSDDVVNGNALYIICSGMNANNYLSCSMSGSTSSAQFCVNTDVAGSTYLNMFPLGVSTNGYEVISLKAQGF